MYSTKQRGIAKKTVMAQNGKWVAFRSIRDDTIITCGSEPKEVEKEARRKGVLLPVITYLPFMDIKNYPFILKEEVGAGGPRPYLPVKLTNPETGEFIIIWGLIDTGASRCILPNKYAKQIGIDITKGIPQGGQVNGYVCPCYVEVMGIDKEGNIDDENIVFKMPNREFFFSDQYTFALLGVNDFLKDSILTIDYPKQTCSVKIEDFIKKPKKNHKS